MNQERPLHYRSRLIEQAKDRYTDCGEKPFTLFRHHFAGYTHGHEELTIYLCAACHMRWHRIEKIKQDIAQRWLEEHNPDEELTKCSNERMSQSN